ncbi:MAG: hypothetical protein IH589_01840 [Anaerolineales bacterium]|nr:hypothetical protein [Anaerolineales bacterium]
MKKVSIAILLTLALVLSTIGVATAHQDGPSGAHLFGTGAWGNIELLSVAEVTQTAGLVADVAVNPAGTYAFLANWGEAKCALNSEAGGQNNPDAGAWIVDIRDLTNPTTVGFIPSSQDSRPGEGMQVVHITTQFFNGDLLVMNNEQCGKNGKGGVSLYDVTNPLKPYKVSEHFGDRGGVSAGDSNDIHSAFAWDTGPNAYVVMTDNFEGTDVDILDITKPNRPRLIAELDLNTAFGGAVVQSSPSNLTEVFLHDMVVKNIGGNWVMLLSYWDGGYVQLNVNNPANPTLIGDTDYAAIDPQLLESTGASLAPEGNGHQNEFTLDNKFFIGTDEDFAPYQMVATNTTDAVVFEATQGSDTPQIDTVTSLVGQTVFVGRACNGDPAVSPAGSAKIALVERGLCTFTEKLANVEAAGGYDGVVVFNREGADACSALLTMSVEGSIPAIFVNRPTGYALMNDGTYNEAACLAGASQAPFALGTLGDSTSVTAEFNGWGYVHLFSNTLVGGKFADLDTFAIPEAMNPSFASGYGDLSVHEVATDPQDAEFAYLSYYAGGLRSLEIQCSNPLDETTCELVEVGGYLDEEGNNFWGVETFVRNGQTIILGSDRDSGLWIFRRTP